MKNTRHNRAASDAYSRPSRLSIEHGRDDGPPPLPPQHGVPTRTQYREELFEPEESSDRDATPDHEGFPPVANGFPPVANGYAAGTRIDSVAPIPQPFHPVQAPPAFAHKSSAQPPVRPNQMPEMRAANQAIDPATLAQLADASHAGNDGFAYTGENGSYGAANNFGGPLQAPQAQYAQTPRRGSPGAAKRMPTIPGTPAANMAMEQRGFDLPVQLAVGRDRSPGGYGRKPVQGQGQNYSQGGQY